MKPLVSVLIPAYNAEQWIAQAIQSAVDQTWDRKEIIVVNDGSRDHTHEIALSFERRNVKVISTENCGLSAAVNTAFQTCQGDYIQELDSDDLISPDKIEIQLAALREGDTKRTLLSSPWAFFYYRHKRASFIPDSLWQDLSPVEWLLRKMGENLHMQNATWLVSREVFQDAGPWDETLHWDQDGEFFCRVLVQADAIRFVPEGRIYYRTGGSHRITHMGSSDKKRDSLVRTIKMHIKCLREMEESERVRKACVTYIQNWLYNFYPDRPDLVQEMQSLADGLGGRLETPRLRWKYAWMKPIFGFNAAMKAQTNLPFYKSTVARSWDKAMYRLETRHPE